MCGACQWVLPSFHKEVVWNSLSCVTFLLLCHLVLRYFKFDPQILVGELRSEVPQHLELLVVCVAVKPLICQ